MSISTIASSTPAPPAPPVESKAPEKVIPDKTPEVKSDADANDAASAYQPPAPPPLPPGQGTRVDQWA